MSFFPILFNNPFAARKERSDGENPNTSTRMPASRPTSPYSQAYYSESTEALVQSNESFKTSSDSDNEVETTPPASPHSRSIHCELVLGRPQPVEKSDSAIVDNSSIAALDLLTGTGLDGVEAGSLLIDPLSPTLAFTSSLTPNSLSTTGSMTHLSASIYMEGPEMDKCWNPLKLLELTNAVRRCIQNQQPISQEQTTELQIIFEILERSWKAGDIAMTIYDAIDSHLSDLVDDLLSYRDVYNDTDTVEEPKLVDVNVLYLGRKCYSMLPVWNALYKNVGPQKIADIRLKEMLDGNVEDVVSGGRLVGEKQDGGILRGMSIQINDAGTGPAFTTMITTFAIARSQTLGSGRFTPGDWWPNKAAAARDGIITARMNTSVTLQSAVKGPTALAMMRGKEVLGPILGMTSWSALETEDREVLSFIDCKDEFRVLRGHTLRGPYSPSAGVRYDGLYRMRSFGYKMNEDGIKEYTITMMRADYQVPLSSVLQSPRPHELDLFKVYVDWVRGEMATQASSEAYAAWRLSELKQQQEKHEDEAGRRY